MVSSVPGRMFSMVGSVMVVVGIVVGAVVDGIVGMVVGAAVLAVVGAAVVLVVVPEFPERQPAITDTVRTSTNARMHIFFIL